MNTGIGNKPTPEQQNKRLEESINNSPIFEFPRNVRKAADKYEKLVQNLTLEEFIGLYLVVQRERTVRIAQQMETNPFFAQLVAQKGI